MTTLLTPHPQLPQEIEEEKKRKAAEEEALNALSIILAGFFSAFKEGDITLDKYIRYVHKAVSVENIPPYQRQKKLGMAVEAALKCSPAERGKNSKRSGNRWLMEPNERLIYLVREREGLPITRIAPQNGETAFERVSEFWRIRGVNVPPSQVERFYYEYRKSVSTQ